MNIFVNIDVLAFLPISPFGQKLTDFILIHWLDTLHSIEEYLPSCFVPLGFLFRVFVLGSVSFLCNCYPNYVVALCIFYGSDIFVNKALVLLSIDAPSNSHSPHVCCRVLYSTLSSMCGV